MPPLSCTLPRCASCSHAVCCPRACACSNRKQFENPSTRLKLGFLYDGFSKDRWWFEEVCVRVLRNSPPCTRC